VDDLIPVKNHASLNPKLVCQQFVFPALRTISTKHQPRRRFLLLINSNPRSRISMPFLSINEETWPNTIAPSGSPGVLATDGPVPESGRKTMDVPHVIDHLTTACEALLLQSALFDGALNKDDLDARRSRYSRM